MSNRRIGSQYFLTFNNILVDTWVKVGEWWLICHLSKGWWNK